MNNPVELLQQVRSNFIIESDVASVKQIKRDMRLLTKQMSEKQTHHDELIKQLQAEVERQQNTVQSLIKSFQEQKSQVRRVESELNIPQLEQEIDDVMREIEHLRSSIQNGISSVMEIQRKLLEEEPETADNKPEGEESKVRVLKLKMFHSLDLALYNGQLLDLRHDAAPLDSSNVWKSL